MEAFHGPSLYDRIRDALDHHIIDNDTGDVSPATLWDAAKAVLRGELISYTATFKRAAKQRTPELEANLAAEKTHHKHQDTVRTL
ncbi:hypothetical protein NDU88_000794 [Pleurodeles waltl]|uniref:Uncharacterized protein n=1 Tax=Pleurodeles waltl TaxID=8319 RepID=A0AAV7MLK1_PLEWA|nr:hypothetical protein NDU88_000794 [Pleurodeles waltl]